jgi:hypothetical protein
MNTTRILSKFPALILFAVSFVQINCTSKNEIANSNSLASNRRVDPSPKRPIEYGFFEKKWKDAYRSTFDELERNRNKWHESKIQSYDFVISKGATGHAPTWDRLPVLIKVRNGERTSIEKVSKDDDHLISSRTDGFEDVDTIDKLFDHILEVLDEGNLMDIEYDENYGYPTSVQSDASPATDDERAIIIKKLEIVE